jgi:hypothetical protein
MELFADRSSMEIVVPPKSCWQFMAQIVAYDVDDSYGKGWFIRGAIRSNSLGAVTPLGTLVQDTAWGDAGLATADAVITAANGALVLTVTGLAGKTIRWTAVIHTVEAAVLVV